MNIEIYVLCHQEAKIIPYFMRHYSQYGQVFMYEGHSTDGSRELAESLGAIIVPFDTGDEVRDDLFTDMKNNCWKASKADWVIICDMDEFLYHPNFVAYLETVEETIVMPKTYEMFSDVFPTTSGQIYEEVQYGFPTRSKMFLFKPQKLFEISYGAGCHDAQPEGCVRINRTSEVICMHMRHLSIGHIIQRNAYLSGRMSEINKRNGWGWHTAMPAREVQQYFNEHRSSLIKII